MVGGVTPGKAVLPTSACQCSTPCVKLLLLWRYRLCYLRTSTVLQRLHSEAIDAGIKLIITITEGIPTLIC